MNTQVLLLLLHLIFLALSPPPPPPPPPGSHSIHSRISTSAHTFLFSPLFLNRDSHRQDLHLRAHLFWGRFDALEQLEALHIAQSQMSLCAEIFGCSFVFLFTLSSHTL